MSATPRHDALLAACAAFGLEATGDDSTLAQRIGTHIAERLFGTVEAAAPVDTSSTPQSERKRPRNEGREKKPLSEKAARWFAFLKSERVLVKQTGLYTGNADVLKEVAARYKRHLAVGTPNQPALLAGPSTDTESEASSEDGLLLALRELSQEEVDQALEAQGVEATPDAERNVALLAQALMV
jgi:hypothetical protein